MHCSHSKLNEPFTSVEVIWEYLLHVSTFATTRVALPTGVEPG
jgi:hypothetical protein